MSDTHKTMPGFIYAKDVIAQAKSVANWSAREARKAGRSRAILIAYGLVMTLVVVFQSWALSYTVPLIRILPVFFYQKPDGVLETAITTESLPSHLADVNVQAWLWQYVMHRESYSWWEQDYNNHVVQAMSDGPVRDAYMRWSSGKNPTSYMGKYGRHAVIRVGLREVKTGDWQPSIGGQPGHVTFHFDRQIFTEGESPKPAETWTVTVGFIQNYSSGFNVHDITEFNPSRIVVTDYPGPEPLSTKVIPQ